MSSRTLHERASTLTIAISTEESGAWDVGDISKGSLLMPAALTGSEYAVEGRFNTSDDFAPIAVAGTLVTVTHVNDQIECLPEAVFACKQLRFVSDGTEAAARTLKVFANG